MEPIEKLLEIRLSHLNTIPLDKIQDTIFALFFCEQCGKQMSEPVVIMEDLHGMMNDFPLLTKTLLEQPSKFIAEVLNRKCDCEGKLTLRQAIYCRTNSKRSFDTHFRINYATSADESPVELAILTKDGNYSFVDKNTRKELLGI